MISPEKIYYKDRIASTKCKVCGGELRPVNEPFIGLGEESYENWKKAFKEQTGMDWKESPNWNCVDCFLIYDADLNNTGSLIPWPELIKKYYDLDMKGGLNNNDK